VRRVARRSFCQGRATGSPLALGRWLLVEVDLEAFSGRIEIHAPVEGVRLGPVLA
jgi:hypothetical protein